MSVIDLSAVRMKRREAELRQQFGIEPGQTAKPIGYLASLVLEKARLRAVLHRAEGGQ